jgi:hypothetical protein
MVNGAFSTFSECLIPFAIVLESHHEVVTL